MKSTFPTLSCRTKLGAGILGLLVLAASAAALYFLVDLRLQAERLLRGLENAGPWGPVLFIGLNALTVLLVLPGVVLTLGSGALFGTILGSLYVVLGTTLGATAAFLLGCFVFQSRARHLLERNAKLRDLNDTIIEQSWKIVMLTRMIPFFPFKASNYAFGIMGISCRDFVIGTVIGIIPLTLTNVHAGALAGGLADLNRSTRARTPGEWAIHGLGLIALLVLVALVARQARRSLNRARERRAGERCPP